MNPIEKILRQQQVIIVDGAMATELERAGCNLDDPLWSARVLLEAPELIKQVHSSYFRSRSRLYHHRQLSGYLRGFRPSRFE